MAVVESFPSQQPVLTPVGRPLSLVPVGLKEAALDSPSFRATASHFSDQIDAVEKWLEGYVKSANRLASEISVMDGRLHALLQASAPPSQLSEAVLDHDFSLLAIRRYGEAARETWAWTIGGLAKIQHAVADPIKGFLQGELRDFKDARRQFEHAQRAYDSTLSRYLGQVKSKEASALREDAFQLHDARKVYLKASMDFCVLAPQIRALLDALVIKVFSDQWLEMKDFRETPTNTFVRRSSEVERIRAWSAEMTRGEKALKRELLVARHTIEERAEVAARPSKEFNDYTGATTPGPMQNPVDATTNPSKQGWLFLRTAGARPARTTWTRRWCFVKNGMFGWLVQGLKSGGVEESEKIGVLLCSVRPAPQEERRFCFEVKTKDTTIVLQAETQSEVADWIAVFDTNKRKALETPATNETTSTSASDAAFAVSPAIAPELAVKRADGQITNITEDVSLAPVPDGDGLSHPGLRSSMDVSSLRRDRESDSARDHAARIIHKLDLHRKSNAGQQLSVPAGPSSPPLAPTGGGLASLIAASQSIFPVGPARSDAMVEDSLAVEGVPQAVTSLAPPTLANPPAHTNLTKTSLMVGLDRSSDLANVNVSGSGLMANTWGSTNYGHISRLERGEIGQSTGRSSPQSEGLNIRHTSDSQTSDLTPSSDARIESRELGLRAASPMSSSRYGTTNHNAEESSTKTGILSQQWEFPANYPAALKVHDAQFRMFFPNVARSEKVVLVFTASWNPDENQDLPGRAYVTEHEMFFYSHHLGLVLVSSLDLNDVKEVSASSDAYHDTIYFHLKNRNVHGHSRIVALKTFLEPVKLLQRRLSFLVSNANAAERVTMDVVLNTLISMESDNSSHPGITEGTGYTTTSGDYRRRAKGTKTSLRVDQRLYGGDAVIDPESNVGMKFRLPTQPIQYVPQHMSRLAAEKICDISAKALFHMMFGDKSAMFQMLYRARRAQSVKQFPWIKLEHGHYSREFQYQVQAYDRIRRSQQVNVLDVQTVDVANDHLCYVITDTKTPWHLPLAKDFMLVTKIVITHVAKSKCKLAIFTKVEWHKTPRLSRRIIERHALDDLYVDAMDIIDLVSDQVQKLGPDCYTKRAISIFGHIGQQTEVAQITSTELHVHRPRRVAFIQKSLSSLVFETTKSVGLSAAETVLSSVIGLGKALSAHTVLVAFLILSLSIHMLRGTQLIGGWWSDRNAANFMARMGVAPNAAISKAIYLRDLQDAISPYDSLDMGSKSLCTVAFQNIAKTPDMNAAHDALNATYWEPSARATAKRLHRTRWRMATYRHDLLLAMRLVNNIERETIQAEYENWLLHENANCREFGMLLLRNDTDNSVTSSTNAENIRKWHRTYCESCKNDQDLIMNRVKL